MTTPDLNAIATASDLTALQAIETDLRQQLAVAYQEHAEHVGTPTEAQHARSMGEAMAPVRKALAAVVKRRAELQGGA